MGVAAELQSRGQSVLVVCSESAVQFTKDAAARYSSAATAAAMQYHGIAYQYNYTTQQQHNGSTTKSSGMMKIMMKFTAAGSVTGSALNGGLMLLFFKWAGAGAAEGVLGDVELMQRLRNFQPDAVMAVGLPGSVISDNLACLLSHALGRVPFIDINGNALLTGPPSVPQFGAGLVRGVRSKKCEALLEVTLGSWLVEYPRPLAANQVMVGPGSPRAAQPITSPPEVAEFIAAASSGLVLVAFGTMPVVGSSLTATDILEMAHAFVALAPLRFLWAMKQAGLPQGLQLSDIPLGDNCMIVPWVDQNDVLGHPNTRAFVSHAGLHSVYEAAFHGVPLAAVPFHFESLDQALKLAHRGAAVISRHAPAPRAGDSQLAYTRQAVVELMREVSVVCGSGLNSMVVLNQ
ncbi:hypothetical protein OEZ86_010747 [Tetradesmus obliquus]|nr:hypothetical protein OEZ86_010747 [Tetradesmus obliquus]